MIDNQNVGRRIAELRQLRRLTQAQLAALMDVSHQAVSKWESGAALPDIQTMLRLTEFLGITVERLLKEPDDAAGSDGEATPGSVPAESDTDNTEKGSDNTETADTESKEETKTMTIMQLLQMAPFMSKETVEEIAMNMETMEARDIARLAPFIKPEAVKKLVDKHAPELNWDVLRRLAPFMTKEDVDALARSIANGDTEVKPSQAEADFNKTMSDIGKTFDDIGKGVGKAFEDITRGADATFSDIGKGVGEAMKKAVQFGTRVFNEVSSAFESASKDASCTYRSERGAQLRRMAFERAVADGKWDWLAQHMDEIREDRELMMTIAEKAKAEGKLDWIRDNMNGFSDTEIVEKAIADGDWNWLGEYAWQFDDELQLRVARAAAEAKNWQWLSDYSDQMKIDSIAAELAEAAHEAGEIALCAQLASMHMSDEELRAFALVADAPLLALLAGGLNKDFVAQYARECAGKDAWDRVSVIAEYIDDPEVIADLTQTAVENGNFDAIDMLQKYL